MAAAVKQFVASSTASKQVTLWTLTDADNLGDYLELPFSPDRSVHVIFTAGTGTIDVQGTNEPTPANPFTLHSAADGTALTFTASSFSQVLEECLKIRPILTGSTGATVLVYLCSN